MDLSVLAAKATQKAVAEHDNIVSAVIQLDEQTLPKLIDITGGIPSEQIKG